MSHVSKYGQTVKDVNTFCQACEELGHKVELATAGEHITVRQYMRNAITDAVAKVHLKGWQYPIAVNGKGELLYDHWGSASSVMMPDGKKHGTMELLGEALQLYNQRAIQQNVDWTTVENLITDPQENGDIKIVLEY